MTDPLPLRALLLDLDGVLVDSRAVVERTWRRWAESHDLDAAHIVTRAHGRPSVDTVAEVAPWLDVQREVAALLQWELTDVTDLQALPGAAEVVRSLGSLPWAVVTSGQRALADLRLRTVDLPIPDVMVTADDVTDGKPHPEPYLRAVSRLGMEPSTAVVVEDSPAGVAAARAAGMAVVALTTTYDRADLGEATVIVPDLRAVRVQEGATTGSCLAVDRPVP